MLFLVHKEVRPMAIDKADLDEYTKLETEAADLERQAKTRRDRQSQLEKKFEAELVESKHPSCIRHGFTFAWVNGRATVPWEDEYLREMGTIKTDALKRAAAAKVVNSKMTILPPATPVTA